MIPPLRDYIDGAWSSPSVALEGWLEDPATGEGVGPMLGTDPADVERALAAAARVHAQGTWSLVPPAERATVLERIADALEARRDDVAAIESAQTGVVLSMTSMLSIILPGAFRLAAEQARSGWSATDMDGVSILRKPWGPAVLLVPWNAPAPMAAHKVANALAAGCPAILKPSEFAPAGCQAIAQAAHDVGLPPGVFQLVNGGPHVGGMLVTDPRVRAVSFTGGLRSGREIARACAHDFKPAQLELGGNNPAVVMDDADTDATADGIVALLTSLNGQWCRALGRLILPEERAGEFLSAIEDRLAGLQVGPPLDPASQMGPLVHSAHLGKLREAIEVLEKKGGRVYAVARVPERGNYLAPTLIEDVDPADAVDEIFGPVATVHRYRSIDDALAIANGTPFGLEGYVFGADETRALSIAERVRAGEVKVNGSSVISLHLMAPRPAWGLSGFAEEGTAETFRFFCGTQVVGVERGM